ncbi:GNAT family N-acetyltransferase [Psychrobacillus soli]|uniref:GNAT family N-acetyltransferase n=1 Tax=Psychrobacillus soli TaxID=1543965 RepID=A0A544TKJ5_9BACI|nr:GNAT family N-acetyltransferase [Psychrobacillus soli]TQR17974.1 GNAT family N-acetyltransferase [Psychrobacillus soli]
MDFPVLETNRLKLIEIKEAHVDHIYSIFSNEEVIRFYGMAPFQQKEQAINLIQSFSKNFQEKRSIRWGIYLKETYELVGTLGLNNLSLAQKRTEIGYDLLPAYWRRGIVSEAVEAIIHYCFEELKLFRIGAVTFTENESSYKLLLKLGFQQEGLLRGYIYQNDKSNDTLLFSLIKPEWKQSF